MFFRLLQQCKSFSRENWWIYILLFIALIFVISTGKGSLLELIVLFSINLLGAMCNMLMMSSYKDKRFIEGSIFILLANLLYTSLSLYAWLHDGDMQYIFWQASFLLTGFKAFFLYGYQKRLYLINFYSILTLNTGVIFLLILYIDITLPVVLQSIGIFSITLGLALMHDIYRYFLIVFGNFFVVFGSILLLGENYLLGTILGVTVAYLLLGLSTFVYYLKLLPLYISRYKEL